MGEVFYVDVVLLLLVVAVGIAVVRSRNLLASTMLLGVYSLLMALVWANMFAMDVAFTEAAVGAGISTILLLGTMAIVGTRESEKRGAHWPALLIVGATGAALLYGTLDMPGFGDPEAPVHLHVSPEYIAQDVGHAHAAEHSGSHEAHTSDGGDEHAGDYGHHVPNLVTGVLAGYRSYDTMFETAVIFTAGICLVLLLRGSRVKAAEEGSAS